MWSKQNFGLHIQNRKLFRKTHLNSTLLRVIVIGVSMKNLQVENVENTYHISISHHTAVGGLEI